MRYYILVKLLAQTGGKVRNKAQVSAFVTIEDRDYFAAIAKKQGRSTSGLIRDFIQKEIRRHERKERKNGN